MTSTSSDIRVFETGASRNSESGKLDYEGFLSPLVLERYAKYLHKHRTLSDGTMRSSDNWQKGINRDVYMKSLLRHLIDVWKQHDGFAGQDTLEDSLCGVLFNTMGYLFETLKTTPKTEMNVSQSCCDICGDVYHSRSLDDTLCPACRHFWKVMGWQLPTRKRR